MATTLHIHILLPATLPQVMEEYYGAIRREQGGLFIAVCRGKVRRGREGSCEKLEVFQLKGRAAVVGQSKH